MTQLRGYWIRIFLALIVIIGGGIKIYPSLEKVFFTNIILNGIILGVFIIGVLYCVRQLYQLHRDNQAAKFLPSLKKTDKETTHIIPKAKLLKSLLHLMVMAKGEHLEQGALECAMETIGSRLEDTRDISRYLISLLVFLGLLGIVWGLVTTAGSIGDAVGQLSFPTSDFEELFQDLRSGLKQPIVEIGTAFSTSLMGLIGALLLGFFDLQLFQAQRKFYRDLQNWVHKAYPGTIPRKDAEPAYIQAFLAQAEELENLQHSFVKAEENKILDRKEIEQLISTVKVLVDKIQHDKVVQEEMRQELKLLTQTVAKLSKKHKGD